MPLILHDRLPKCFITTRNVQTDVTFSQAPPTNFSRPVSLGEGLYVCGDHRDSATLDGALFSGRQAAEALLVS